VGYDEGTEGFTQPRAIGESILQQMERARFVSPTRRWSYRSECSRLLLPISTYTSNSVVVRAHERLQRMDRKMSEAAGKAILCRDRPVDLGQN
jgi:hypothetical protein